MQVVLELRSFIFWHSTVDIFQEPSSPPRNFRLEPRLQGAAKVISPLIIFAVFDVSFRHYKL